jgi:hypothetical protein
MQLRIPSATPLLLLLLAVSASAQTVVWEKTFGTNAFATAIERTSDGGYVVVGQSGTSPGRLLIVRVDPNGEQLWERTYGGSAATDVAFANGVITTSDGGYLVAGGRLGAPYLMKLDATGDSVWARNYGVDAGNGTGSTLMVTPTADGGYMAVGNLFRSGLNASMIHLYKVSATGVEQWEKLYGNPDEPNLGTAIRPTSDGNFAITGYHGTDPGAAVYLAKVGPDGEKIWDDAYPGIGSTRDRDDARDLRQTADGGYVLAGRRAVTTTSYDTDLMVMKTSASGSKQWEKTFGGAGYDLAHALQLTSDGGMVVAGAETATLTFADRRVWIVKLDGAGNPVWEKTLVNGAGRGVVVNPDGSIVVAGSSGTQVYLVKLAVQPPDRKVYRYPSASAPVFEFRSPVDWESAGPGKIRVTDQTITINGLLRFTGTMTIDTTNAPGGSTAPFTSNGRFWIADAPLPKGQRGEMTLFEGSVTNGGIVPRGIVLDVLDRSAKGPTLVGLPLRALELTTIGGAQATAVGMIAHAPIAGVSRCGIPGDNTFIVRGIEIGGERIAIGSIEPIALGPLFCLEEIVGDYNRNTDNLQLNGMMRGNALFPDRLQVLTGITDGIVLPVAMALPNGVTEVRLGNGLMPPKIRDLAVILVNIPGMGPLVSVTGTIVSPDGYYNTYVSGATLSSLSSLTADAWDVNMGEIDPDVYHITGTPAVTLSWTPQGIWTVAQFEGALRAGRLTSGAYAIDGTGKITAINFGANTALTGTISGTFTRPRVNLGDWQGFEMFMYGMPAGATLANHTAVIRKASDKGAVIHTTVPSATRLSQKDVTIDLSKTEDEPGFFASVYDVSEVLGSARRDRDDADGVTGASADRVEPFDVAASTEEVFLRIWSQGTIAGTYLTSPSGSTIDGTTSDSSAIHVVDPSGMHFWALRRPAAGTWSVGIRDGAATDSIELLATRAHRPFDVAATQQGRTLNATWSTAGASDGATVALYLDTDSSGYDGIPIGEVDETTGTFTYTLSDSLPACRYHLFAIRDENGRVDLDYAPVTLDNAKATLAAPGGVSVSYSQSTKAAVLTWTRTSDPAVVGHLVRVTSASGVDSIVALPFAHQTTTSFIVEAAEGATVAIASYDSLGRTGCWSEEMSLIAAGIDHGVTGARPSLSMTVAPNPMRDAAHVRIVVPTRGAVELVIVDMLGRDVMHPAPVTMDAGETTVAITTAGLVPGTYMLVARSGALTTAQRITVEP